jgi:hypothetical protein
LFGTVLVLSAAAVVLPPVVAISLARRRRRPGALAARRTWFTDLAMVIGTLPPVLLILMPTDGPSRIVTPLRGLHEDLAGGPVAATVQIGGNLLVFVAFGLLGPLRWRIGIRAVVVSAAAASTVLELAQYVLDLGRVTDLVDVVLNATGAGLAALCVRRWWLLRPAVVDREAVGNRHPMVDNSDTVGNRHPTVENSDTVENRDATDGRTATITPHRYGERST